MYTHTHTHARTHARMHAHMMHARTHAHTHTHARTHAHTQCVTHTHTHTCTHTCTHASSHAHTQCVSHTHTYTHARTHARMQARMHTHTHMHARRYANMSENEIKLDRYAKFRALGRFREYVVRGGDWKNTDAERGAVRGALMRKDIDAHQCVCACACVCARAHTHSHMRICVHVQVFSRIWPSRLLSHSQQAAGVRTAAGTWAVSEAEAHFIEQVDLLGCLGVWGMRAVHRPSASVCVHWECATCVLQAPAKQSACHAPGTCAVAGRLELR